MKKAMIVTLVCVNAALLAALMLQSTPKAQAQALHGATDYLVVTGQIETNYDGLYIIDLAKRKMIPFAFDRTKKRMMPFAMYRKLDSDFQTENKGK